MNCFYEDHGVRFLDCYFPLVVSILPCSLGIDLPSNQLFDLISVELADDKATQRKQREQLAKEKNEAMRKSALSFLLTCRGHCSSPT